MTTIDAARAAYENLPEDENHPDRVQQELAVIDGEDHDAYAALAIIDHVGAAFEAQDDGEAATRALGSALCEAAVMLSGYRLAISPVLELVRENCQPGSAAQPVEGPAKLARAVRQGAGLNLEDLVSALALSLAQALDSVQIMHAVTVDLGQLFVLMARERMGWKTLVVVPEGDYIPTANERMDARAGGLPGVATDLGNDAGYRALALFNANTDESKSPRIDRHEYRPTFSVSGHEVRDTMAPKRVATPGHLAFVCDIPQDEHERIAAEQNQQNLADRAVADRETASWHRRLCPVCAGPMSYLRDNLYGCGQHEHQEEHLRNIGLTQEDLDHMRAAPAPTAGGRAP